MKVLVVDDSRAMRALISAVLKKNGYEVITAGHGEEALQQLEEHQDTGLAMVDWNMPVMDGLTFIGRARQDARFTDLHIMMITTEVEMSQVERALNAGANEYLMKPFAEDELIARIQQLTRFEGA